jgi:hypothetical protein
MPIQPWKFGLTKAVSALAVDVGPSNRAAVAWYTPLLNGLSKTPNISGGLQVHHNHGAPRRGTGRQAGGSYDAPPGRVRLAVASPPPQQQPRVVEPVSAPLLRRGFGTSNVSARRLRVEWSGTARFTPRRWIIEPINPAVWRRASPNTALNVSAVKIAKGEYHACPPRVVRGVACQPAIASSLNQMVRLPRWHKLASYSFQFVTSALGCGGDARR